MYYTLGTVARSTRLGAFSKPLLQQTRHYIRPHYYQNSSVKTAGGNPFQQLSRRLNNANPDKVLWAVIGTNVGVFLLWQYAVKSYEQFHDPSWLKFMAKNFVSSEEGLMSGRIHTLLTSAISHKSLDHLGINMLVLYSMGQGVIEAIGASRFLLLYGGAGITASLVAIGYRKYIKPRLERGIGRRDNINSLGSVGASGKC
jgi:membrane associated rhomboid family serine protease